MSDEQESRTLRKEVDEAIVYAREAKNQYQLAAARGDASAAKDLLLDAAIPLHNILKQWRNQSQVEETWEENGLDAFTRALNEREKVSVSSDAASIGSRTELRLAIKTWQAHNIAAAIDGLLEVAKDLGFAPQTTDTVPLEIGRPEDVRWILNRRDQSKGLEDLEPPPADEPDETEGDAVADGGVAVVPGPDDVGPAGPTVPDERVPFRGPFFQLAAERKSKGQDVKLSVASANAETGVGKSTCAYYLAHVLDTSPSGFSTAEQATLNVGDYLDAYNQLAKGSAVILDEAEQLTKRRATSKKNVKTSERLQMNRVKEISALFTLPKFDVLDPLVKDLLDFRVEVERLGLATIYQKTHSPFSGTYWQEIQQFEFPDMDFARGMQQFHGLKDQYLEDDKEELISTDEVDERVEDELKDRWLDFRNERIVEWEADPENEQSDVVDLVSEWCEDTLPDKYDSEDFKVGRSMVSRIVNSR